MNDTQNDTQSKDDPRLTAFALGELEGDERAEFEATLRENPDLLAEVDAVQKLGLLLEDELAKDATPTLSEEARAKIEAAAAAPAEPAAAEPVAAAPAPEPAGRVIRFKPFLMSVAAVLVGGVALSLAMSQYGPLGTEDQAAYSQHGADASPTSPDSPSTPDVKWRMKFGFGEDLDGDARDAATLMPPEGRPAPTDRPVVMAETTEPDAPTERLDEMRRRVKTEEELKGVDTAQSLFREGDKDAKDPGAQLALRGRVQGPNATGDRAFKYTEGVKLYGEEQKGKSDPEKALKDRLVDQTLGGGVKGGYNYDVDEDEEPQGELALRRTKNQIELPNAVPVEKVTRAPSPDPAANPATDGSSVKRPQTGAGHPGKAREERDKHGALAMKPKQDTKPVFGRPGLRDPKGIIAGTATDTRGQQPRGTVHELPPLPVVRDPKVETERTSLRINVDANGLDLADALEQIGRQTGRNILVDRGIRRTVKAPPPGMNWREAVEHLARQSGTQVEERPGGVILLTQKRQQQQTTDTPFKRVDDSPLTTFSIDVDTASYSTVRKFLKRHTLPAIDAVRVEELINYFPYDYAAPAKDAKHPFAVHTEVADCPWKPGNQLVRVALKGKEIDNSQRPTSNLVFLLDVSGSMGSQNKLPLLKKSLRLLVEQLGENDRVAIVVYAGASGLALPSTPASDKETILSSLDRLNAGGSTNGGAGIQLAYNVAVSNFIEGGTNRVILCTDGDFNVGVSRRNGLVDLIQKKAKSGVFLSVMGFGMNHSDKRMEALADKGNGHYAFIDTIKEANKVFVEELGGTLVTIAKDVKIQVEFNPLHVESYRLIGYANRQLANRDFADDTKDAGEIGAGHTVTAFYEIVPAKARAAQPKGDLKYQKKQSQLKPAADSDELMTVKLRYKQPEGDTSTLMSTPIKKAKTKFWEASQDFRFAASVAAFGMTLRNSPYKGNASYSLVEEAVMDSMGHDEQGYRAEFLNLVKRAKTLSR